MTKYSIEYRKTVSRMILYKFIKSIWFLKTIYSEQIQIICFHIEKFPAKDNREFALIWIPYSFFVYKKSSIFHPNHLHSKFDRLKIHGNMQRKKNQLNFMHIVAKDRVPLVRPKKMCWRDFFFCLKYICKMHWICSKWGFLHRFL